MTCIHYSPEFITARMREREAGNEPPCPHCRLAEVERLLKDGYPAEFVIAVITGSAPDE